MQLGVERAFPAPPAPPHPLRPGEHPAGWPRGVVSSTSKAAVPTREVAGVLLGLRG